jgi:hypothetical protein
MEKQNQREVDESFTFRWLRQLYLRQQRPRMMSHIQKRIKANNDALSSDVRLSFQMSPQRKSFDFKKLPREIQIKVASFLDVPTLGYGLACTSRSMHIVAKHDSLWAHHLRFLLWVCFDQVFVPSNQNETLYASNTPLPLHQSPLQSTQFLAWYSEWLHHIHNNEYAIVNFLSEFHYTLANMEAIEKVMDEDNEYKWFFEDVSLLKYYKSAGSLAFEGEREFERKIKEHDKKKYELVHFN